MKSAAQDILDAPAERLGLFRVLVGGFSVVYLLVRGPSFLSAARSHPRQYAPVGLNDWLTPLAETPLTPELFYGVFGLTLLLGLAFAVGWRFLLTGPAFAFLLLWVTSHKSSFGMVFHTENLLVLQVLALAIGPSAAAVSLDARAGRGQGSSIPPGWPLLLAALIAIACYLLAGIAKFKIAGAEWMSGDVLRIQVAYDNLRKIELGSIHSPIGAALVSQEWLFPPLAVVTMLAEFGGPLALLHRRFALFWSLLIVGFHWGVLALMAIVFAYPMSGIPLFCLFPIERSRPGKWALKRLSPSSHAE